MQRNCEVNEYKDEEERVDPQKVIIDATELKSKAVSTLVSSKSIDKKVPKVVERELFEEEIKTECEVEKRG